MTFLNIIQIASSGFSILAMVFAGFLYFRDPQTNMDKEGALLAQQVGEIDKKLEILNTSFNTHVAADQSSMNQINGKMEVMGNSLVELKTIIDERIPKKKK